VVKPGEEKIRRLAMFKNGHLRLLMTLVGFEKEGIDDELETPWIIPSSLSSDQLKQSLDLIKKSEFNPPVFDDGKEAGDFITRKSAGTAARRRAAFDDEDDGIDDDDDEEPMFPAGGPTAMKKSDALAALKKTRRRRRREGTDDEPVSLTDEQLQKRADARRARELEKNRKIKSELFVHDSDEESDQERDRVFFAAEEKLRERSKIQIMEELLGVGKDKLRAKPTRKRRSSAGSDDTDDSDGSDSDPLPPSKKRQSSAMSIDSDGEDATRSGRSSSSARDNVLAESDGDATDTPMSSPHVRPSQAKRRKVSSPVEQDSPFSTTFALPEKISQDTAEDSDDDEDVPVFRTARQRVRSGFIVDSSDEE
jgi:replication fork protection complex subunit Tof1/Swi1